jgi:hypothetical protein
MYVGSDTITARLPVGDVAFDATCIAGNASEFCTLSWWFRHGVSEFVGKEPTSAINHEACHTVAAWLRFCVRWYRGQTPPQNE